MTRRLWIDPLDHVVEGEQSADAKAREGMLTDKAYRALFDAAFAPENLKRVKAMLTASAPSPLSDSRRLGTPSRKAGPPSTR